MLPVKSQVQDSTFLCARGTLGGMRQRTESSPHIPFIVTGLAFSLLGGFTLAIAMPVEALFGLGARSWVAHAQVHGHLQAVGFVALMIVGVSYHLLPAFLGRAIAFDRLTTPSLYLLAVGVLLRVLGQPLAQYGLFAGMAMLGSWLELAGALCFAAIILGTLRPALTSGDAMPPFFAAGAVWFVVQAALGAWWVAAAAAEGSPAIAADRNGVLVGLQLFAFALLFILGVGVRAFPVFFAITRFGFTAVAVPLAAWQAGLVAYTVSALLPADASWAAIGGALVLIGGGIAWITLRLGWYRPPSRIRPASRPFALPLQMALAWLTFAGVVMTGLGVWTLAGQAPPAASKLDAVRHIVAVGVILTTIVAMAQLVLPEFASERFEGKQGAWRGILLGALLSLATVLRAGSRWWAEALPGDIVSLSMAVGGVIAMGVMAAFAFLYVRSVRNHRALLQRFAEMSAKGTAWTLTRVEPETRR